LLNKVSWFLSPPPIRSNPKQSPGVAREQTGPVSMRRATGGGKKSLTRLGIVAGLLALLLVTFLLLFVFGPMNAATRGPVRPLPRLAPWTVSDLSSVLPHPPAQQFPKGGSQPSTGNPFGKRAGDSPGPIHEDEQLFKDQKVAVATPEGASPASPNRRTRSRAPATIAPPVIAVFGTTGDFENYWQPGSRASYDAAGKRILIDSINGHIGSIQIDRPWKFITFNISAELPVPPRGSYSYIEVEVEVNGAKFMHQLRRVSARNAYANMTFANQDGSIEPRITGKTIEKKPAAKRPTQGLVCKFSAAASNVRLVVSSVRLGTR
jgi:hypothetical protein